MKRDEAEKLLGGYATGTLTGEERQLLFTAAIEDQKLFEALADEEALRDALSDDTFRRELIGVLSEPHPSLVERLTAWWRRPYSLALAGGVAAVLLAAVIVQQLGTPDVAVQQVAMVEEKERPAPISGIEIHEPQRAEPKQEQATPTPVSTDERSEPSQDAAADLAERQPEMPEMVAAEAQAEPRPQMQDVVTAVAPKAERMEISQLRQAVSAPPQPPPQPAPAIASRRALTVPTAAAGERAVLSGVRVTIERSTTEGYWTGVSADTVLGLTDTVRLRVEADVAGYLRVTDSAFPSRAPVFSGPVTAGSVLSIPTTGSLPPPDHPGARLFHLVLSGARTGAERVTLQYGER